MPTRHYGHTDVGRVRAHNEDAFLADQALGLFVVFFSSTPCSMRSRSPWM